jgi:hypothetical protein
MFGCCFHGVVDLVQFIYVTSLVLEASDRFRGLSAMTYLWPLVLWGTCMKTS